MNARSLAAASAEGARTHVRALELLSLLALYVIWGSTYYALRLAVDPTTGFPPLLLAGIRYVIAGGILFIALRMRGVQPPDRTEWLASTRIGFLLLTVGNGAVCYAEQAVSSSLAAVVVATMPLWAAVFARLYGERSTRLEWFGLCIGFTGVVVLSLGGELRAHGLEALALALAPLSWALGSVQSRRVRLPEGAMATAAEMLTGGGILLLFALFHGERVARPDARAMTALGYLIVFGSLVAFSAFTYLIRTARPSVATSYAYVNPLVALLLGVGLGGEQIRTLTACAAAIIIAGVAFMSLGRRRG
jgi:drug/metabolite transporter (DMT)-like permease